MYVGMFHGQSINTNHTKTCSDHELEIEIGRHRGIQRLCNLYKVKVVKDECHVMFICPLLREMQVDCLKPFNR
jgi:hypothetical protein